MAELDERERINQELREEVHQELDIARGLIFYSGGSEAHKSLFTKFDNLVSDRSKRLKSDTLRKLLEHIKNLQVKAGINQDKQSEPPAVEPVTSTTSTPTPEPLQPSVSPVKVASTEPSPPIVSPSKPTAPKPVEQIEIVPTVSVPVRVASPPVSEPPREKPAEEEIRPPREIISEEAKLRQKAQIPWRTPTRLEPYRIPRKHEPATRKDEVPKKTPVSRMVEPLPLKEPERLALRYKTKARKRPAEEALPADSHFKKPFAEPQKPLFQRRHQLAQPAAGPGGPRAAANLPMPSRDPRNYGDYCNRRMTLMQNRARFERQNQQYFPPARPQHEEPGPRPVAAAHPFAVPAPVQPAVRPAGPIQRPPAPKASVAPNVNRPPVAPPVVPAAPVPPVVRQETRKTNPVYTSDEPIRLGKKDEGKKQISPSKPAEEPEPAKPAEKEPVVEESAEKEKPAPEVKQTTQKEKDNALQKNLMDMLQVLGEGKAKMILDVIGKKSDDESEKPKEQPEEEQAKRAKAIEKKTGKKFKRIRAKQDESSSEDEAQKKELSKKEKAKPAKRVSGGSREVSALIENSSDWMAKGSVENHYTRRRGTAAQLLISPQRKEEDGSASKKDSSDEDALVSSKEPVEDDNLLTVAKVVPVAAPTKGKQKAKEPTFVYNDKKTVHCNSNFSSNCALCSFNGSAIVDHYVYDHKTYEVFVSRVSPKMADIIRSDLFMTNGTLLTGDNQEEKIRFKCYFCLAPKELGRGEWTDHLSSHTGEYRYRCTSCPVMSRTEELGSKFFHEKSCLKPTLAIYNNIEFEDNHLYGFICDACNFIQIRRVNMERHLKREHPSSDVTCSRFSILNYKVETKPIVDEELLMMADLPSSSIPTVMVPFSVKAEPLDTFEIVNQPFTEDEEMPEMPTHLPRRTEIRLESVHIGQVGSNLPNQLSQLPYTIKMEPGLQQEEAISSSNCYESPMSPEPAPTSEAQAAIPVLQIQCVTGGVDLGAFSVKQEKHDDVDSDASDATVDLNLSAGSEGRQCATDTNQQSNGGSTTPTNLSASGGTSAGGNASPVAGGSSGGGGAAGAGGDDGDDRKKEEFPVPLMIKVEKDEKDEEEKKKALLQGVTTAMENVQVKTEKPDQLLPEEEYDFVELILDSKRMQNVAFVERNSEALFLCVSQVCKFVTKDADALSKHIARNHRRAEWDGYCQICRSQITPTDCSITDEYQHLLTIHARKKTPPLDIPANVPALAAVPNVIRIRRMPGDTLSMGDSIPPPLAPIQPNIQPFVPPMIIQSGATISPIPAPAAAPVPIAINQLFTPTHTIPAQIRPITATVGPNITMTPLVQSPSAMGGPFSVRTVHLKPWTNMVTTKSQEHCREMLEEISLLCLFKCMSRACAFTTNHRLFMAKHLANHDALYRPGPTAGRRCWLECAYCDLIAPNSGDLLIHIDTEHSNCGFQCNLCFYRSRDPTNVVVHQKDHHPAADIPRKILIMPDNLRSFGDEEWRAMQESLRQHVLPLHCTSKYDHLTISDLVELYNRSGGGVGARL